MADSNENKDDAAKASAPNDNQLPKVESPSISPADDVPQPERVEKAEKTLAAARALTIFFPDKAKAEMPPPPRFKITPRMKRSALLAASVAVAAALGAIVGVAGSGIGKSTPVADTAGIEETQAMRNSLAHLAKDVAALKAGIETANKNASAQIGKIADRIDRFDRAEITGSIAKVATTPTPAPTPPIAAATPLPPTKPQILEGWSVRAARNGAILVEGHGDIFEVAPGVPLPGLGPVGSISRDGDRWVVTTPKGLIVSSNAPPPQRRRVYYPPYFRPF
jgi:hypothetical protein